MSFITNDKLDFVSIHKKDTKTGFILEPELSVIKRDCLMTKGHAFYAVWDFENGMWCFDELRVPTLINIVMQEAFDSLPEHEKAFTTISDIGRFRAGEWSSFKAYCKQLPDKARDLDTEVTFVDEAPPREAYRARRLPYSLSNKPARAYHKLAGILYDPEELEKLEWSVGLCLCGEQSLVHKFVAIFGGTGTGKSTYLNIIDSLFQGYTETIHVSDIVDGANAFALSGFASNPLVILEHDCNLSRIKDNSRLNSMAAHEKMQINVKNQSLYTARILGMMFLGTNKPIHITDARSGLARRLIDVSPSGRLVPQDIYDKLVNDIKYELGSIAYHCINVYRQLGRGYYSSYIPVKMMVKTNVIYSFVMENANELDGENGITLTRAFNLYKKYCEDYNIKNPLDKTEFRDDIEEYFLEVQVMGGGRYQTQVVYKGLNPKMLKYEQYVHSVQSNKTARPTTLIEEEVPDLLEQESLFDELRADCKAQYTNADGGPITYWTNVKTTLSAINTRELHYVRIPKNHIIIDLDLKNSDGEKELALSLEAAKQFPETYMEVSKSGKALHLHYIYDGDVDLLDRNPEPNVEVKVYVGKSALRRKLTLCNNVPVATISSGLKLKEKKSMTPISQIKDERHLRSLINKALKKEVHGDTNSSVDFIKKTLDDAIAAGVMFDVSDLYPQLIVFAAGSSHNSDRCVEVIRNLQLSTIPIPIDVELPEDDTNLLVYDIECFPNLFTFSYTHVTMDELRQVFPIGKLSKAEVRACLAEFVKKLQEPGRVKTLVNPTAEDIAPFINQKMVGFNNRRYDNHEVYARYMGENNMQCYLRSQAIINGARDVMNVGYIPSAWNMSFLDLYDLATDKQSLKKWQVVLRLPHQEYDGAWDQDVPEDRWDEVSEYNQNDVVSSVCLFAYLTQVGDMAAREILANISGLPVGQTLRNHFAQIIFQGDKNPQKDFIYTDLSEQFPGYTYEVYKTEVEEDVIKYKVKSDYMETDPSEGGRVHTEPGVYYDVGLFDIEGMHPTSIIQLNLFGTHYTQRYKAVYDIRLSLKHSIELGIDPVAHLQQVAAEESNEHNADIYARALEIVKLYAYDKVMLKFVVKALKLGLNSTYGWTAASFPNAFRDPRNVDNIVAKRGALFMITLQYELQNRGVQVVHVKTDSVKIPGATSETVNFINEFAAKYGYTFAHEDTYRIMCLVNKSVYICYSNKHSEWEATGAQFAHPVVFKTLFTGEPLTFEDYIEVKEVKGSMYLSYDGKTLNRFIGRIGEFVAVKPIFGGDILRVAGDKQGHVVGTKGYKWEEADRIPDQSMGYIDKTHYDNLVAEATRAIEEQMGYGDPEGMTAENAEQLLEWTKSGIRPIDMFTDFDDVPFVGAYLNVS